MKLMLRIIFIIIGILYSPVLIAQKSTGVSESMDAAIFHHLERINYWSSVYKANPYGGDSLFIENKLLLEYLTTSESAEAFLERLPKSENRGLINAISDDKKLRIYAWDTWTGGSIHYFNSIAHYKEGDKIYAQVMNDISDSSKNPDPGYYPMEINTVTTKTGNTLYLVMDCSVVSARDKTNGIKAFSVESGRLRPTPVFKIKRSSSAIIEYLFDASFDSGHVVIAAIHFSPDKKQLYIPIVENGKLQKGYWVYVFNGEKYVYRKRDKKHEIM